MAKTDKTNRPEARLPKGFRDTEPAEIRATHEMLGKIREVYERYGFEPLETPAFEYTDALGKFLPDTDRPNEGVFSLQDEDEQWMSLRYDLTAPLARYVAQNFDKLPKPFRRYATGPVWRNEKPGPGRFRQFTQFDADTVGTDNVAADAEICMLAADTLEALGIARGQYVVKVNNRKIFEGLLEAIKLTDVNRRLSVLRAIDKYDRLGLDGVKLLLGRGRTDDSGDFTKGAGLDDDQANVLLTALDPLSSSKAAHEGANGNFVLKAETGRFTITGSEALFWRNGFPSNELVDKAFDELRQIEELVRAAGYGPERISIDPTVVRGLEYYTGPVFEAELTFEVKGEDGKPVRFGSVGGGGRYDDLVARFTGQKVPATGFSIGVSRLQAALSLLAKDRVAKPTGPVVVLVMDKGELPRYQALAQTLRQAGIRAEMYLGTAGMKPQMKYADKRGAPCVIIQGSQEREKGEVQIKDLIEGAKAAALIKDSKEWREARPAQFSVPEAEMVAQVRAVLARHS